jgi:hypothetical protein
MSFGKIVIIHSHKFEEGKDSSEAQTCQQFDHKFKSPQLLS